MGGMIHARGRRMLMVDADGATKITDVEKLEAALEAQGGVGLVVGSRAHMVDDAVVQRSFLRNIAMWGFHVLVWILANRTIKDTQCGFKLFDRRAAKICFLLATWVGWERRQSRG